MGLDRTIAAFLTLSLAVVANAAHGCASSRATPTGDRKGGDPSGRPLVGPLTKDLVDSPGFSDCGCTLRTTDGMVVFRDTGPAWMNIEGSDVVVHEDKAFGIGGNRSGDTHRDTFSVGEVLVRIDWVVTSVCSEAPDPEGCEFTGTDATITAEKESEREVLHARGGCGC